MNIVGSIKNLGIEKNIIVKKEYKSFAITTSSIAIKFSLALAILESLTQFNKSILYITSIIENGTIVKKNFINFDVPK